MSKHKKKTIKTSVTKTDRAPILSGRDALAALQSKNGGKKKRPPAEPEADHKSDQAPATGNATENSAPNTVDKQPAPKSDKKLSALDAAAQVLAEADAPMNTVTLIEQMIAQGLWSTRGKTPAATLYSSIIREIATKGEQSRFLKTDRGLFVLRKS